MYTVSGGYYYAESSSIKKETKDHRLGRISMLQLCIFLSLLILSFVFGAVIQAFATNDVAYAADNHTAYVIDESTYAIQADSTSYYETHIVDSGQSLWVIAKRYAPANLDIRQYVNDIINLNQLDTNTLFVGQRLLIPSAS